MSYISLSYFARLIQHTLVPFRVLLHLIQHIVSCNESLQLQLNDADAAVTAAAALVAAGVVDVNGKKPKANTARKTKRPSTHSIVKGESQLLGGEAYNPLRPPPKPRPMSTLQRPPPHPKHIKSAGTSRIRHQLQSATRKLTPLEMERMESSDGTGTDNEQPQQQSTTTTPIKHTKHRKKQGTKVSKKNGATNGDSGTDNNSDMDEIESFIGIDNTADSDDDEDAMTEADEISLLDSQVQFHHEPMDYEPMADADQEAVFDAMKVTHPVNVPYQHTLQTPLHTLINTPSNTSSLSHPLTPLKAKYHWPTLPLDEAEYRVKPFKDTEPKWRSLAAGVDGSSGNPLLHLPITSTLPYTPPTNTPFSPPAGGFGIFDLPPWARDSQRRSLGEIRKAHRRWKKSKREAAEKARHRRGGWIYATLMNEHSLPTL